MRVSLEWLGDYVDLSISPSDLAERLTNSGTAVDAVETVGYSLKGFRTGRIMDVKPHPSADRLSVCGLDVGESVMEVVCGAPNARKGEIVPVALPGSTLPDGTSIKEASIRGVTSLGMILSEKELGISDDAEGIMILDESVEVGVDLAEALGLPDTVFILEVTPNRPDCLSMLGVAREVAALTGQRLNKPLFDLRESEARTEREIGVEIKDPDLCSRYVARVIRDLDVAVSPWWMRRRLQAAGVRPINNIVDVTNYVMLELGQPLHAFDYRLIKDGRIIVRRAAKGEKLTTLDGVERELDTHNLLICDIYGPVALAGVMGGEQSEVSENTSGVLLESAHFDPTNIMYTSRVLEFSSEASYRFERGVDPNGCIYAADRAAFLMQEFAGGEVTGGVVDTHARVIEPVGLTLRAKRAGKIIGITLSADEAGKLLRSIDLKVEGIEGRGDEEILKVEAPTFRPDLEREIDLVEEVARLYGYQRISPSLPVTSSNIGSLTREQRERRRLAGIMAGLGLHEAITQSFIAPRWLNVLDPGRDYLTGKTPSLRNPISEEITIMRPSLLPGLLEAVRFNLNRRIMDISLFEMGKVFLPDEGSKLPWEPMKLGLVMVGSWIPKQWDEDGREADFFTAKGILEGLISSMHIRDWDLKAEEIPFLHPTQSCTVLLGGKEAGCLGVVHPRVCAETDLPENMVMMEIDVQSLIVSSSDLSMYEEIPRFPSVQMDVAVVVKEEVPSSRVREVIRTAGGGLLREARLFDLYAGEQISEGEKSLAFALSFYALDRTLRDEEVREIYDRIVEALGDELDARLR